MLIDVIAVGINEKTVINTNSISYIIQLKNDNKIPVLVERELVDINTKENCHMSIKFNDGTNLFVKGCIGSFRKAIDDEHQGYDGCLCKDIEKEYKIKYQCPHRLDAITSKQRK